MTGLEISPELVAWLALRRVHGGHVVRLARGLYLDGGRPIPAYVADAMAGLITTGLVAEKADPDMVGQKRLHLTDAGATRYAELSEKQRVNLPVPPPEFTTKSPAGRRFAPLALPGGQPDPS